MELRDAGGWKRPPRGGERTGGSAGRGAAAMGVKLEVLRMTLYLSFPVAMFWISNQAEYFEKERSTRQKTPSSTSRWKPSRNRSGTSKKSGGSCRHLGNEAPKGHPFPTPQEACRAQPLGWVLRGGQGCRGVIGLPIPLGPPVGNNPLLPVSGPCVPAIP
ncbi:protein PET100 homolog, mitochondrial isoform X1 [Alligator sinensis]|uniref:Protein PET100 homolog, mitochondrial isoform X1 n=1 Tax=Alligator sinensis TaxID=38654 RepID=A0A3Q0HJ49_ALLSI|nr:protein PET100 homolog, mitochondrial isoform X1 [Alligator sinensis]